MKFFRVNNSEKLFISFIFVAILLLPFKDAFTLAQNDNLTPDQTDIVRQIKTSRFMDRVEAEITSGEDDLIQINRSIADMERTIRDTLEKIDTLEAQVANLDRQIASAVTIIESIENQIAKKQSDIDTMEYQIEQKKIEISYQKQMLLEYLKVLFKDQTDFSMWEEDDMTLNTFKVLLSDDSTGSRLRSIRYSEVLEEQGREIFSALEDLVDEQEADQKILEVKKHNLIIYHQKLSAEKEDLDIMQEAKLNLLDRTKGQEKIYNELLQESRLEQEDVLVEIDTLRKNLIYVQDRARQLGDKFDPSAYANLFSVSSDKLLLSHLIEGEDEDFTPAWPVNPARGITAYYREVSYAKFFGMQHNAIDIRASQGTPVRSAEDGVVYKAIDNGYGYSYIMIAHYGGYMTLYGHISNILVTEGDVVSEGDIIGLSGGVPGTKGAGVYTTGAHLHFEILKDGLYTDPLDSMNLAYLDFASLPEKYVAKALGDRKKVRRFEIQKVKYSPAKEKVRVNSSTSNWAAN